MPSALKRPASPTPTPGPDSPAPPTPAPRPKKRRLAPANDALARLVVGPATDPFAPDATPDRPTPLTEFDLTADAQNPVARLPTFVPIADGSLFAATPDIPHNRSGYRYVPAWSTAGAKCVDRTAESPPQHVCFSWEDRSQYVRITHDAMAVTTDKGFRSARCNVPVREGKWYVEMQIIKGGGEGKGDAGRLDGAHVRVGWGRREAPLNGPVGMDGYSYGMRDLTGEKVTLSRPKPYGQSFRSGDVVGMYISLPPRRKPNPKDPNDPAHLARKRIAIPFKRQVYFESLDYKQSKEMMALMDYSGKSAAAAALPKKSGPSKGPPGRKEQNQGPALRPLPVLSGSMIAFFVNGECQGPAFRDVYDYIQLRLSPASQNAKSERKGMDAIMKERENNFDDGSLGYYPFVSVFNDAQVRINPGPDFLFPPPSDIDAECGLAPSSRYGEQAWRPLCERYQEYMHELWEQDAIDAVELNAQAERLAKEAEQARVEEAKKQERLQKNRERAAQKKKGKAMSTTKDNTGPRSSAVPEAALRHVPVQPADDIDAALLSFVTSPRYTGRPDDIDDALLEVVASPPRKSAIAEQDLPSPTAVGKAYDFTDSEDDGDASARSGSSAGGTPAPEEKGDDDDNDEESRAEDSDADGLGRESMTEGDEGTDVGIDAELALLME